MFDPFVSGMFHLPLVLMGINPIYIFMGEILVQVYQFWIHNEMIRKLGPLEWIFNTPSHHRVHHGSDRKYLDKNFGGITIIYDRIFGTFQEEEEIPTYGLTTPINTVNPIKVQFFEFGLLFKDMKKTSGISNKLRYLIKGPGWSPKE
jgi:sterol desaturase/sphingolipid hydroxylase (fatty acid hydroxylase superfamily)